MNIGFLAAGASIVDIPFSTDARPLAIGHQKELSGFCGELCCGHFVCYSAYFNWLAPENQSSKSARRVMENLANFEREGHPVALFQPTERMEGAAPITSDIEYLSL